MAYGIDYRRRVISFINEGASKADAARLFKVNPDTIYEWLKRKDLSPTLVKSRHRKICKQALVKHVQDYPDALLRERAEYFGVHINAIWVAMRKLGFVKKRA
jgi:putative transposase